MKLLLPTMPLTLLRAGEQESIWLDGDGRWWSCPRPADAPKIPGAALWVSMADMRLMPTFSLPC
jgi:hypothetical protein